MECVSCAQYVSEDHERCPQCGRRQPDRKRTNDEPGVKDSRSSLSSLQRIRDDFKMKGEKPSISEWDRASALRSLRSLSPVDYKTFNNLAIKYGGCGDDLPPFVGPLILRVQPIPAPP